MIGWMQAFLYEITKFVVGGGKEGGFLARELVLKLYCIAI